jgi:hypothetical protein
MNKAALLKQTIVELIQDIQNHILKDSYDKIEFGIVLQAIYTVDNDEMYWKIKDEIAPFKEQIQLENEEFFLNDNTILFKKKDRLKKIWLSCSEEDKTVIWSYVSTILKLAS